MTPPSLCASTQGARTSTRACTVLQPWRNSLVPSGDPERICNCYFIKTPGRSISQLRFKVSGRLAFAPYMPRTFFVWQPYFCCQWYLPLPFCLPFCIYDMVPSEARSPKRAPARIHAFAFLKHCAPKWEHTRTSRLDISRGTSQQQTFYGSNVHHQWSLTCSGILNQVKYHTRVSPPQSFSSPEAHKYCWSYPELRTECMLEDVSWDSSLLFGCARDYFCIFYCSTHAQPLWPRLCIVKRWFCLSICFYLSVYFTDVWDMSNYTGWILAPSWTDHSKFSHCCAHWKQ